MGKLQLHNPWKGVVPYSSAPEDIKLHPFRGRDKDIKNLIDIIDNNEITTLYGRSGIGKTSLLNAGLFPQLRTLGCFPISIRLHGESEHKPYSQIITDALTCIASSHIQEDKAQRVDPDRVSYLWHYFATHSFIKNDVETTPIIILDQFEETLRNNPEGAVLLLRQLRKTQDDGICPDGSYYRVNFRFVISLREDDLFLLEDALDTHYIDKMKNSRYRLQPIDKETAIREIINIREGLYEEDGKAKNEITDKLLELATQDGQVSSLLLSLVCSMAYEAASGEKINKDSILKIGENPLTTYYKQSIVNFPQDFVDYFESKFTDADRKRIVFEDTIETKYLPFIKKLADENNDHRLLTLSSNTDSKDRAYELLHDKLAEAINSYKEERYINEKKERISKYLKNINRSLLFGLLCAVISAGLMYIFRGSDTVLEPIDRKGAYVPISSKPYYVQNGFLQLTHCKVKPYTFYGNREVTKLLLDSVDMEENALFLPNVDTLIIGSSQWCINPQYLQSALPNVHTIVAIRPSVLVARAHRHLPSLQSCVISPDDQDVLRWDSETKVLFARKDTLSSWVSYLSSYSKMLYREEAFVWDKPVDAFKLVEVDLVHLSTSLNSDKNTYYKLINTDSTKVTIIKEDIPDEIRDRIIFIDLPYIQAIRKGVFDRNTNLRRAILPDVQVVGANAFEYAYTLHEVQLPRVKKIERGAFHATSWNVISLDSVTDIQDYAIIPYNKGPKIKKINLPQIQHIDTLAFGADLSVFADNLLLEYNTESPSAQKLFGRFKLSAEVQEESAIDALGYHYSLYQDTLYLDSIFIPHLKIAKMTRFLIWDEKKEYRIDKASVEFGNPFYIEWRKDIYMLTRDHDKNVIVPIVRTNRETLVSLPRDAYIIPQYAISTSCLWKNFICLDRSNIAMLKNTENITLYVPYGQIGKYKDIGNKFYNLKELDLWKTLMYRLRYSRIGLYAYWRHSSSRIDFENILAALTCFLIMLLMSLVVRFKHINLSSLGQDVLVIVLLLIVCSILVSSYVLDIGYVYHCSCGNTYSALDEYFRHLQTTDCNLLYRSKSMWTMLWFALPLHVVYCTILVLRTKFNHK